MAVLLGLDPGESRGVMIVQHGLMCYPLMSFFASSPLCTDASRLSFRVCWASILGPFEDQQNHVDMDGDGYADYDPNYPGAPQ
jgi:hypothetical protein